MILVQISLRNGLRSALTLSKLNFFSGGACPQTPLVGAASAALLSLHPLFKIPGYATDLGMVHYSMLVPNDVAWGTTLRHDIDEQQRVAVTTATSEHWLQRLRKVRRTEAQKVTNEVCTVGTA